MKKVRNCCQVASGETREESFPFFELRDSKENPKSIEASLVDGLSVRDNGGGKFVAVQRIHANHLIVIKIKYIEIR